MKVEITLSIQQLAGILPIYIKGKTYWLVNEKQQKANLNLKAELRRYRERFKRLVDVALQGSKL